MAGRSDRGLSIPDWVVLDNQLYRKDLASFGADGLTSADGEASNGEPVKVSVILHELPDTSRICVHCPEERDLSSFDSVVAAHGGAVLFRLEGSFEGLTWRGSGHAVDYFIYWACPTGPKLSLLPRGYSTENEVMAAPEGSWRRLAWPMMDVKSIGLLLTDNSGGFVVTELHVNLAKLEDDVAAPLEAELFRLCSHSSATDGEWEVQHTKVREGKATFCDLNGWWEAHKVVPYGSYLCWVDYTRGVIFCHVNHPSPELQYLSLPVGDVPVGDPGYFTRGWPQGSRAVSITRGGKMKFVNIVRSDGRLSGWSRPNSGFTINVFTLMHKSYDDMEWGDKFTITATQLWAMEGFDDLPRVVPEFPLVSMDNPNIIYFVLKEKHPLAAKTWVVTLDMNSELVVSYKSIKGVPREGALMASHNIYCNAPFFPSEFSKYLHKASEQ
ncbi:hypothetical protein ACP70R_035909 [Stipagrostis hirtigluma subsp. patula]